MLASEKEKVLVEKEFSTTDTEVYILYNCKRWKLPYDVQSMIKFENKECILEKKESKLLLRSSK